MLRPLAALSRRMSECDDFGHFPAHFSLDDFSQGNVRRAEIGDVGDERPVHSPATSIQLADAPRNQVDQYVRVKDYRQRFLD